MSKILISFILLMTIGFGGCNAPVTEITENDGGVKKYNSGENFPKTIESEEIVCFECEFSLISFVFEEESELDGRVYTLSAVLEDEDVSCIINWYDRAGKGEKHEFTAGSSFMTDLQKIVSKYDFAKHNGFVSVVSGLPDMYGAKLDIKYKSGESIYAHDNADCFIPTDGIKELVDLFGQSCDG